MHKRSLLVVLVSALAISRVAEAHFNLMMPAPSETDMVGGKGPPPCGSGAPSNVVTPVTGGQMITLRVMETVYHPGHYRVALAPRAQLPADPMVTVQGGQSVSAKIDPAPQMPVLADGLFVHTQTTGGVPFQAQLKIPNIDCPSCILQVIEFMAMHGLNQGGGYFYHHCAELKITAGPNGGGSDGGAPDAAADTPAATDVNPGTGGLTGNGGSAAAGGASGTGGSAGTGGASGTGGVAGSKGGAESSGGCAVAGRASQPFVNLAFIGLGVALLIRFRRRRPI